ncbi:uncharacterized protein LOC128883829 isoform X3 [Hylaeus volcanicus]|uniref:uncharacterized protein LOC128883829 isoform X3 n=1 Tax=Hylaeus volcanicus TaxID=313075 RepID=UPI0023B780B1|nr:uncharacterized protein LOC128883829 isoform X3 [Hylaeus volcanicus]
MQPASKKLKKTTRWMNLNNIRKSRFWDVTFPGTHNSATWCCSFNTKSEWSIENNAFIKLYVVCQKLTIYQQLTRGIRFLDLRVCKPYGRKKEPYCAHNGFLTVPFRKVLTQVRLFCTRNPSEIIILSIRRDVSHLNDTKSLGLIESDFLVALLLRCYLGPALTENVTIGELADRSQRVIYFFEEQERFLPSNIFSSSISSSQELNVMLSKKFWRCIDEKQKENRKKKKEKHKYSVSFNTIHVPNKKTSPFQENIKVIQNKGKSIKKGYAKKEKRTGNQFDASTDKKVMGIMDSGTHRKVTKYKDASEVNTLKPMMSLWLKKNISNLWYSRLESLPRRVYKGVSTAIRKSSFEQITNNASLLESTQVHFDNNDKVKCIEKKNVKLVGESKKSEKNKKNLLDITKTKLPKRPISKTEKHQLKTAKKCLQKYNSTPLLQCMLGNEINNFYRNRTIFKNSQKKAVSDFFPVVDSRIRARQIDLKEKWNSSCFNPVVRKNFQCSVPRIIDEPSAIHGDESKKKNSQLIPINQVRVVTSGVREFQKRASVVGHPKNQSCNSELLCDTFKKNMKLRTVTRRKEMRLKNTIEGGVDRNKPTRIISFNHQLRSTKNHQSKTLTNFKSHRSRGQMCIKNRLSYIALNSLVSRANICGGGYFHAMLTPFMCGATRMFKSWSETSETSPITLCAKLVKWSICYGSTRPRVPFVLRILAGEVTPPAFESFSRIFKTVHFWTSCYISTLLFNHSGLKAYASETHKILLKSVLKNTILNNINCITHDFANRSVILRIIKSNNFGFKNE